MNTSAYKVTWLLLTFSLALIPGVLGCGHQRAVDSRSIPELPSGRSLDDSESVLGGLILLQGRKEESLSKTRITVLRSGSPPVEEVTNNDGSFLASLAPGTYQLNVERPGWQAYSHEIVIPTGGIHLDPVTLLLADHAGCPGSVVGSADGPQITGASAVMHSDNSLIFDVGMELSPSGTVWVEYFPAGNQEALLRTPTTQTVASDHIVPVLRLTPETVYCYQTFAKSEGKGDHPGMEAISHSFPGSFTTGPLPKGLAASSFRHVQGNPSNSLTLLDLNGESFTGFVAIDGKGQVVWYYQHQTQVFAVAQDENYQLIFGLINGTQHLEISPEGSVLHQVEDNLQDGYLCAPGGRWHHESLLAPNGEVYLLGSEIREISLAEEPYQLTGDTIVVWDREKGSTKTIASLFDLLDPVSDFAAASYEKQGLFWRGCEHPKIVTGPEADTLAPLDWTHSNAIWLGAEGNIIVSIRHLDQIISIAPDLNSVQWRLGGTGSDFRFPDPGDRFYHQHSVKELPGGTILLFDNGNGRPNEEGGEYSRALELMLDFSTMEAHKVWEYRQSPDLFADCCSSVERLESGNTLTMFGADGDEAVCCRTFTLVESDNSNRPISVIEISSPGVTAVYRAYALDSMSGESRE